MIENKHIFITGGAGFIANTLIKQLVGKNRITVYDNFHRDTLTNSGYADHKNIFVVKGDVLDYDLLERSMNEVDIVIHAAAIAGIDTVIKSPVRTMRVNMIGTANVMEAAYKRGVKDRVVEFSTSEVFGSMAYKSSEDDLTVAGSAGEARWTYAVSKLAGEHIAKAYHTEYNLPVVTVRPFNVYGPGQTGEGAMQIFIKRALKNEPLYIYGEGTQIRAWCYVTDFVNGLIAAMTVYEAIGESFNLGNPRAVITTLGLAESVCRVLNSQSKIEFRPALSADVELRIPSVEKMQKVLGIRAQVDLEEGIKRTAEWFQSSGVV